MNQRKKTLSCILLILFISLSCHDSSKKDLSLAPEEYQKLGMPDPEKKWIFPDLLDAKLSLSTLQITHPYCLPRKYSKKSGIFFSKMFDKENISFVYDTSVSLRDRAMKIQLFQRLQIEMAMLYMGKSKDKQYYSEELIDIYIMGLFIQEKMLELSDKIMNSKELPDIDMQYGQKNVINNYMRLIRMLLEEQSRSGVYPRKDLNRLSEAVSASLVKSMKWLNPEYKKLVEKQVQITIEKNLSGLAKKNYRKTLNAYQAETP